MLELSYEDLAKFIKTRPGISFVDLVNRYGESIKGQYALTLEDGQQNAVIIWPNLSERFCDVFNTLRSEGVFHLHTTSTIVYYVDGLVPNIPLYRKGSKKQEQWVPTVLYPGKEDLGKKGQCRCS